MGAVASPKPNSNMCSEALFYGTLRQDRRFWTKLQSYGQSGGRRVPCPQGDSTPRSDRGLPFRNQLAWLVRGAPRGLQLPGMCSRDGA